jgi:hypothetical protein
MTVFLFRGFHLDGRQKQNVGSILHLVSGVGFQPEPAETDVFDEPVVNFCFNWPTDAFPLVSRAATSMTGQRPLRSVGVIIRKKIPTLSTGFNKREHPSNKGAFHQHPSSCQVNGPALSLLVHCWAIQLNNDLTRTPRVAARQLKRRKADGRMDGPPWKSSTVSAASRQMGEIKRQGTKYAPSHEMAAHL